MKTATIAAALGSTMLLAMPLLADEDNASAYTIEVSVTGFDSTSGELALALFDSEETYVERLNPLRKQFVPIVGNEGRWTVAGLTAGEYVVIAYHDENGNRKLDTRIMGIPKEKVGVSNNSRGRFGPPKFERAKFELIDPLTRIEIRLQ